MSSMNWMKEQAGMEVERHPVDAFFYELCPKLTLQQRLGGYAFCVFIGFILNMGSWARLVDLAQGDPGPFVILFTIGNLISLFGSFILNGPYAQGKKMVGPQMRCATCAYLISMIMTFFVAFYQGIRDNGERLGLIILLIIVQYVCMIWFIICSVWFLKKMVLSCLKGTCTNMCPTCAKGCKCVCDALEEGAENTKTAVKSVSGGNKKEEKKSFFGSGEKKPEPKPASNSIFSMGKKQPEPEPEKKGFFSMGNSA